MKIIIFAILSFIVFASYCFGENNVKVECFSMGCDYKDEFPDSKKPILCPKCGNKTLVVVEQNQSEEDIAKKKAAQEAKEKFRRGTKANFTPRQGQEESCKSKDYKERQRLSKKYPGLCPHCLRSFKFTEEQFEQDKYRACPYCGNGVDLERSYELYRYQQSQAVGQFVGDLVRAVGTGLSAAAQYHQADTLQRRAIMQQQHQQALSMSPGLLSSTTPIPPPPTTQRIYDGSGKQVGYVDEDSSSVTVRDQYGRTQYTVR
jgi:DNA-directed RNA polymerase subunit RPC12/RpoP